MSLTESQKLAKLIRDLETFIRSGNKEMALNTLGLVRTLLGDRIGQDSMDANLRAYEEAQARRGAPVAAPAGIGGFESIDVAIEVPKRGRPKKAVQVESE